MWSSFLIKIGYFYFLILLLYSFVFGGDYLGNFFWELANCNKKMILDASSRRGLRL